MDERFDINWRDVVKVFSVHMRGKFVVNEVVKLSAQTKSGKCMLCTFYNRGFFQSMLPSVQYYIEYIINMCALHINLIDHDIYFKIQSSNYGPLTANQGPLQQKNHGRRVGSVTKRTQATRTNRNATNDQRNFLKEKLNSPPGL